MKLIGIAGKKRAGKDTVADIIKACIFDKQQSAMKYPFALELKEEVATMLGITVYDIEANKDLYRPMLQWYGTDFRRGQNPNYWIGKLNDARLKYDKYGTDYLIVPDVRFKNEAEYIKKHGGIVIHVTRTSASADKHLSEIEMDDYEDYDSIIYNVADIAQLILATKTATSFYLL